MTSAPSSASPVAVGPNTGTGFHGLVAATPVLSPRYPPEQAIPSTPHAPKKNRLAKSCAAVVSPVQFNLGVGSESNWLRFNHRVDPRHKAKASSDKSRRAVKRKADVFSFHWQMTINKKKQKSKHFHAQYRSALCERMNTDADEKDTSSSKNV